MTVALGIIVAALVGAILGYRLGRRAGIYDAVSSLLDDMASARQAGRSRVDGQREAARRGWQ